MKKVIRMALSNKTIVRIGKILVIVIPVLAAIATILHFWLPELRLSPIGYLDIVVVEELPDAISEGLYVIRVKCKRVTASPRTLVHDFRIHISTFEGTIQKLMYTGIIPKNRSKVQELLEAGEVSSIPSIEYPPIDKGDEFAIIVFIRTDGTIPTLQLIGSSKEKKAKILRWREVMDDILSGIR